MHCEQAETLLALLIYDELEAEQKTQLTAHLAECPACAGKLSEMRAAANMLKEAVEAGQPPVLSEKRREALMKAATTAAEQHDGKMAAAVSAHAVPKPKAGRRFFSKKWRGMHSFLSIAAAVAFIIVMSGMFLPSLRYARETMCLNNLKQLGPPLRSESSVVARSEVAREPEEAEEDSDAWGGLAGDEAEKSISFGGQVEAANPSSKARATGGGRRDVAKADAHRSEVKARFEDTGGSRGGGGKANLPAGRGEISNGYQSKSGWSLADGTTAPAPAGPQSTSRVLNEPRHDLIGGKGTIGKLITESYFYDKSGSAGGSGKPDAARKAEPPARVFGNLLPIGGGKASAPADFETAGQQAESRVRILAEKAERAPVLESPAPDRDWQQGLGEPAKKAAPKSDSSLWAAVGGNVDENGADSLPPAAAPEPAKEHKAKSGGGILSKLGIGPMVKASEYRAPKRALEGPAATTAPAPDGNDLSGGVQRKDEFGIQAKDAPWKAEEGQANRQKDLKSGETGTIIYGYSAGDEANIKMDNAKFPDVPGLNEDIAPKAPEKPAFVKIAPELTRDLKAPQGKATEIARMTEEYLVERNRQRLEKQNKALENMKRDEPEDIAGVLHGKDGEAEESPVDEAATIELPSASTFKAYTPNPFVMTQQDRFSTFGLDVDTASYVLARNYVRSGKLPPPASVRPEEFINWFDYNYPKQTGHAFAVNAEGMPSPFAPGLVLLKIGIQGRVIGRDGRKPAHLVFVIDASGSMARADRLPLVQEALAALVNSLQPVDRVSIVTYGTDARLAVQAHPVSSANEIIAAVNAIQCGGSTNLLQGIQLGYEVAQSAFRAGETNRVILCSDGVANIGLTDADQMLRQVEQFKRQGISFMSVGFGMGSYNDELMQKLADRGDGSYVFIDTPAEARRVMTEQIAATLQTIAKDAKIQVEFNPAAVRRYRLIGYEKREIADEDFRNDTIDAGEVGSGQSSTALYEIELLDPGNSLDLGTVFVRYRNAESDEVEEISTRLEPSIIARREPENAPRLYLAAAVAQFAEILRESEYARGGSIDGVRRILGEVAVELPLDQRVRELLRIVESAKGLPKAE